MGKQETKAVRDLYDQMEVVKSEAMGPRKPIACYRLAGAATTTAATTTVTHKLGPPFF